MKFFNKIIYTVLVLFFATINLSAQNINVEKEFKNLGPQVYASLIQGSIFSSDKSGNDFVFTVVRGRPAIFVGFSLKDQKVVVKSPLKGTDGSWDVASSSDGTIYISGSGILYRYNIGDTAVTSLGTALSGEKVIWDLAAGKDGEIFGGTYPGCKIFRYKPKEGFSDEGKGALQVNEDYVRSLVYHKKTDRIYAGIASHSALVELDRKTRQKVQLLPDSNRNQEAIYHMNLVEGLKGGDRVYGWLTGSSRVTVVYNVKTKSFEQNLPNMDVKSIIKDRKTNKVYYTAFKKLYVLDYSAKNPGSKYLVDTEGETKAISWNSKGELMILTANQFFQTYNPTTNKIVSVKLNVPSEPIDIQSIFKGPEGEIWSAGYLVGNHATYDPKSGKVIQYPGLHQTEGMNYVGNTMYFGIYAKAQLYSYDVTKPWEIDSGNPKFLGRIPEQDRPFAVLGLKESQKVLFGTIANYGKLGGAIAHYDIKKDTLEVFDKVFPNQSITSFVESNRIVFGGTTIFGGLGGKPIDKEAKLFIWDVEKKKVVFEVVPVKGTMSVTGLFIGPDKNIWGFADGDLFVFDPVKKEVKGVYNLFKMDYMPTHIWRNGFAEIHPNGKVYCAINNSLYQIEPSTMKISKIASNVSLLTMDNDGVLYFRRNTELWSYRPL